MRLKLSGTIMDDFSAEIMRHYGWNDNVCPSDFRNAIENENDGILEIEVNSGGGSLLAGTEIYSIIAGFKGEKTATIQSLAASSATVAIMACNKIRAEPVAVVCAHNPTTYTDGDHHDMRKTAEELANVKESIINAYMTRTKKTREEIAELMDKDILINAQTALEYGLIDEIIDRQREIINSIGTVNFPSAEMIERYKNEKTSADIQNKKKRELALLDLIKLKH